MAEKEANRLTNERVSLLIELGASKDELFAFRVEVAKDKKALEEEYDADFESIFNYGYGCCTFGHNICESKPKIQDRMSSTSEPLTPELFVNLRCPPVVVPVGVGVTMKAGFSKGVEHSSIAEAKVGDNPDFPSRVTEEREDPDASDKN